MYIKSITLDGFKSYGRRTEITGFDKQFNAITGLNGSGKSNILDAICFVLGLTNMSLARCTNLRELIYKNGQTGITKAVVSITFDNRSKEVTPKGYEDFDEITITREVNLQGRTKYKINGYNATNNQQVTDLFHSVQLNIQNPHFLIMQGRITKVLNMKPQEILSMVEEATGVSMYENKKKSTRALIEKKDAALKNIDSLINETIIPKLDQLKKEQSSLLEFQKVNAELEHLTKVQVLSTYKIEKENCNKATLKIDEITSNKNDLTKRIDESNEKTEDLSKEIASLEKQKDQEFGGKLAELENDLREKEKEETNLSNKLQNQYDELKETEKKISQVNKNLAGDKKICLNKQKELENLKSSYQNLEQNKESAEIALKKAQDNFEAISAGKSIAADGQAATLAEQLMQAKNELSSLNTETQKVQMDMKFYKTELNKKESEVNRQQTEYLKEVNEIETRNKTVDDLKKKLDKMQFDEENYKQTKDKKVQLEHQRRQLDHEIFIDL